MAIAPFQPKFMKVGILTAALQELTPRAVRDADIASFAEVKFKLVKRGRANRIERIERHMAFLADEYDDVIPGLFNRRVAEKKLFLSGYPKL